MLTTLSRIPTNKHHRVWVALVEFEAETWNDVVVVVLDSVENHVCVGERNDGYSGAVGTVHKVMNKKRPVVAAGDDTDVVADTNGSVLHSHSVKDSSAEAQKQSIVKPVEIAVACVVVADDGDIDIGSPAALG
mmetsp:Transcript_4389/g.9132  ORF Transcript_4389/g.9132 Transcript_4389/m.9132 type:complete len:133 (-) Transcript_4389:28-426(-)